ncbi:MAG: patatin-like phospholipase family protein [Acidobacteria bacterium]|nr:patatin-like phospholipase family protein [Acidobacteriota bacterium]MCB9397269.1 patatin-like phospholipase family protein [Acidobacteriota bacterium]
MAIQTVQHPKIGLALAGGGIGGAIYEAGALRAIDDAFLGIDFCRLGGYVGISAGSLVSACLVNGISSKRLCRALIDAKAESLHLSSDLFFKPAMGRMLERSKQIPKRLWDVATMRGTAGNKWLRSLGVLLRALPEGIFENQPLETFLSQLFEQEGCSNSFHDMNDRLFVVASDLDSAQAVVFGSDKWKDVPVSKAVQASTALPGVYPPVEINGRSYVDGVLLRTMNASVLLDRGIEVLIALNPIVPVDTHKTVETGFMRRGRLIDRGLLGVMHQSVRTLIYSRMKVGHNAYRNRFKDAKILLFEPKRDDYTMYFTNILSFSVRHTLLDHAYRKTLEQLRERKAEILEVLSPFNIIAREEVFGSENRSIYESVGMTKAESAPVTRQLQDALHQLENMLSQP